MLNLVRSTPKSGSSESFYSLSKVQNRTNCQFLASTGPDWAWVKIKNWTKYFLKWKKILLTWPSTLKEYLSEWKSIWSFGVLVHWFREILCTLKWLFYPFRRNSVRFYLDFGQIHVFYLSTCCHGTVSLQVYLASEAQVRHAPFLRRRCAICKYNWKHQYLKLKR